jgi:tripartite-type tricarboxylate transporter receptor subunit TctC
VAFYGLLNEQGIPPASVPWIPSQNSAQGLLDLLAGGVDIAPVSHPEARSLIDAKKVKSLAVLDDAPTPLYPDVPTGKSAIGTNWKMGVWRGIGAPKGLPDDVRSRLETSLKKAFDSPTYQEFSKTRGFGARWAEPSDFATLMAESDVQMGATMKAVGLVK